MRPLNAILVQFSVILLGTCLTHYASADPALKDPVDVHRAQWQARPPKPDISTYKSYGVDKPQYRIIVLHSTDMGYGVGAAEAQRIQNYEMNKMGFADIGYNFLIDSNGTIFEGRELSYVPSHAGKTLEADADHDISKDPDFGSIGIAFSSGPNAPISENQIRAAKKLIDFFIQHPKFRVDQVITHAEVAPILQQNHFTPDGDYNPHVCPGDNNLEPLVGLRRELLQESGIAFNEIEFRNLFRFYVKPQKANESSAAGAVTAPRSQ